MKVKIALHNGEEIGQVLGGVDVTTVKADGNRIKWDGGDICAPFFVVPDGVEVGPETTLEEIREQDITNSLKGDGLYMELLKRIQKLESEREEIIGEPANPEPRSGG